MLSYKLFGLFYFNFNFYFYSTFLINYYIRFAGKKYPMRQLMFRNGTQFAMQKLKVIKGSIPKSILGSYIKNGSGLLTIGDQVLPHWFMGNSGLLKVEFHEGNVYAKYKMIQTPAYQRDIKEKNFNRQGFVKIKLKNMIGYDIKNDDVHNSASTGVLRIPHCKDFFALYQGSLPYRIEQKLLKQIGIDNFGFVPLGFSAHPKIDPESGDIYNIGFNLQNLQVFKMSKQLKLIAKNSVKLRVPQSIHDCCMAGDYFVVFECPFKPNLWSLLKGTYAIKCYSVDYKYGMNIAYIFKKSTLQLVKKIELKSPQTFIFYHFTNGYEQNNKICLEYVKFPGENAQKLLDLVDYMPNYAVKDNKQKRKFSLYSQLQTIQINLQDFSYNFSKKDFDCEFPVCEDSQIGKKWQYSYFIAKDKGGNFWDFNKLVKYDRINDKQLIKQFPNCCIVEPSLIRTKQGLFILLLKSSPQGCSIEILQGENLQTVGQAQLPEYIPFGFHGKWLQMQDTSLLESQNM